jgi:thiol peroxidase
VIFLQPKFFYLLKTKNTMAQITRKGIPFSTKGELPAVNTKAIDFVIVKEDMNEVKLSDYVGKVKVLIAVPSLDTSVCATETRHFNEKLGNKDGVVGIVISKDLPFAMKRFCETNIVENIVNGSDFRYGDFVSKYNTEIMEGPFKGLSARAVFVVDKEDTIRYVQLVKEVGDEPDYDKALEAVDSLL